MSRKAARSSSPRRLLRRRRLSTTSLPNPTERRSTATSPASSPRCSFSRLGFFLAFCWSALLASGPSASRLFLRYRIPHASYSSPPASRSPGAPRLLLLAADREQLDPCRADPCCADLAARGRGGGAGAGGLGAGEALYRGGRMG
jgi:hypothetical protein